MSSVPKAPGPAAAAGPYRLLRPWAIVRFVVWLTSMFFGWYLLALPRFVCRWVPHSRAILSISFLYVFLQALGLMWLLVINLCSVCSVKLVGQMQKRLSGEAVEISDTVRVVLSGYVIYCILRILFFIGASFYTIGWEAFSDFPVVRQLIVGKGSSSGGGADPAGRGEASPNGFHTGLLPRALVPLPHEDSMSTPFYRQTSRTDTSEDEIHPPSDPSTTPEKKRPFAPSSSEATALRQRHRKRQRFFREATLLAPLLGLIACTLLQSLVTAACYIKALPCEGSVFVASIADPTGRLNRGIRFAIFVSFLQWAQQFAYIFPTWHKGLMATPVGKAWALMALPLWPLAVSRFAQWTLLPAGTGMTQHIFGGLPHHIVDIMMILFLKAWMLGCCLIVLRKPEQSGFDWDRRPLDDGDFKDMSMLFKYSFIIPMMLHFLRGCLRFGVVDAQNDLLVIVCAYPLLLVTVWTIVWVIVVSPGTQLLLAGVAGSLSLASSICSAQGSNRVAAATVVWLHLMRQYLKLFRKQKRRRGGGATSDRPSASENSAHSARTRHSSSKKLDTPAERKWAGVILLISGLIALVFFSLLAGLSVMSGIQQRIDWYPKSIWFEREDDSTVHVNHMVSQLRLRKAGNHTDSVTDGPSFSSPPAREEASGGAGVSYAVCNHQWHGLSVLDYTLLSLASYFDHSDPSLSNFLDSVFPPESGLRWRFHNAGDGPHASTRGGGSTNRLSWIEVEFEGPGMEKPLLVLAVRGTDPTRISDYVEDIRMWTEPVALSILSTVFPTVRVWPRRTVEMVIMGIHDFLDALDMSTDTWSYMDLVHRVSEFPRDQYSQIVLTGHSLGGGMATIVASLTHLPVVGITPPGIYWSIAKHYHRKSDPLASSSPSSDMAIDAASWMHHQSLTLVVENDWVNGIFDDHGGLVQMMTCDRSHEALEMACHMLEGTICHILDRCGDTRRRWSNWTHEYVLKDTVTSTLTSTVAKVLRDLLPPPIMEILSSLWAWTQQPLPPGSRIFNSGAFLCMFFVVLPIAAGIIEELFVL